MADTLLQMRHKQQVPSLKEPVMQGVVVHMAQQGASAGPVRYIVGIDELAEGLQPGLGRLVLACTTCCWIKL